MNEQLSAFPQPYQIDPRYIAGEVQIIVNWLYQEAMPVKIIAEHPILHEIRGWRNKECYDFIKSYDWTARMYQ